MKSKTLRVLLVRNYAPDRQESMLRFADCLASSLTAAGVAVEGIAPDARIARNRDISGGLGKWLAYLDKFVLFPRVLRRKTSSLPPRSVVHICDHSNAMYVTATRARRTLVTCHDLLAVRGALGDDVDCPASATGKILQKWILSSLGKSHAVVCDSTATLEDFKRLQPSFQGIRRVILLGQNGSFSRLTSDETTRRLAGHPRLVGTIPYLLHVGSGIKRKNREGILRVFARIAGDWPGNLVFAGGPLTHEQSALARELGVQDRVISVTNMADAVLEALYNRAFALFFPSTSEGFGWPVVEAQACGCPVITSDRTSLPEVAGPGALIRDPKDEAGYAADILALCDPSKRAAVVAAGTANASRFTTARMIDDYLAAYRELLETR